MGYPQTITLDNARKFVGNEFKAYCTAKGIRLNHTIPYWPQQNGEVERKNRSLLKRLKISHALKNDWKAELKHYLMMYYTTPHSVTGKTPTELCLGRTIRSKIPSLHDHGNAPPNGEWHDRDRKLKEEGKRKEDEKRKAKHSDIGEGDIVI